jgi:hypothetical protein
MNDQREKKSLIAFKVIYSPCRWILIFVSFSIFFRSVLVKWRPWTSNSSDESFFLSANGKKKIQKIVSQHQIWNANQTTPKTKTHPEAENNPNLQRISPGISGLTRSSCQWSPLFLTSLPLALRNKLTLFFRLIDEFVLWVPRRRRIVTFDSVRLNVFVKSKWFQLSELEMGADIGGERDLTGMSR